MPRINVNLNMKNGGTERIQFDYGLSSFEGNCGYRLLYHLRPYRWDQFNVLSAAEKRYIMRCLYYYFMTTGYRKCRKVVLSGISNENKLVTYRFIKENNLQVGKAVKQNTSAKTNVKTILGEMNPYDYKHTVKKPRGHHSCSFVVKSVNAQTW